MLPPATIMFNYLLNPRLLYFFTHKEKIFLHLKGKQVCGGAVDNKNVGEKTPLHTADHLCSNGGTMFQPSALHQVGLRT